MILAASYEFCRGANAEIVERQSDNEEVPSLIKKLPNLGEKNKETPLCHLYSIKARAIIHAHLTRIPLNPQTLEKDRQYIVKKCPYLIQEMVTCVNQLIMLAYSGRVPLLPTIHTIENCMKLSPMVIQGFWEFGNPLLQLPHIEDEHLKHFLGKKKNIKTLQQLAQLNSDARRQILRMLTDDQYEDVMRVLGNMPYVDFKVQSEVVDDDNPTVYTADAIVTVTVTLTRRDMRELFGDETAKEKTIDEETEEKEDKEDKEDKDEQAKKTPWLKQKKGGKSKIDKKKKQRVSNKKGVPRGKKTPEEENEKEKDREGSVDQAKEDSSSHSEAESEKSEEETDKAKEVNQEDDDEEWDKFQQRIAKKERVLEGKSNVSHEVHCPMFPDVKQEYWWVYICDRKSHTLITTPIHVTGLVDREEVQLRFTAPSWPGLYTFSVCLRSDSYLGFYQTQDIKVREFEIFRFSR